ncbi:MAG: hypothetical protein LLG01_18655 [Planctomycetaceae bacterium]|nr:hypothetical protein [Planctomycetaceae bacterium]
MKTCIATALTVLAAFSSSPAGETAEAPQIKTQVLKASWQFSIDEGKTFIDALPPTAKTLMARATFTVDDPAAVAGLWLTHVDEKLPAPLAPTCIASAFAMAGHREARDKNCGASPLWTYTKVQVNGKDITGPQEAMVYIALPVEPAAVLVKGANTLTVSGTLWSLATGKNPCPTKPLQLLAAAPQPAAVQGGPLLGMIDAGCPTVNCATPIPAIVTVTARPTEPAGAEVSASSQLGLYHQVKVPLPGGVRKFTYSITSRVGSHEAKAGPFAARLPAADGKGFKLVAMGNTRCHVYTVRNGPILAAAMRAVDPDVFVHVGQVVELATWDYHWEPFFFNQYRPLVSAVPTYLSPDGGDHIGRVFRAFGIGGDDKPMNWTAAFGDVRLIGCDGAYEWKAGNDNAQWLESVLKAAKEKYIIAFDHFPGYTDGYQSSPHGGAGERTFPPIKQCRELILPMLGKYKAAALVSAYDYNYERLEPTPDKGVTCIIVGAGGAKTYCQGSPNEFTKTAKWIRVTSFVQFELKADGLEMTAIGIDGKPIDSKTFKPR